MRLKTRIQKFLRAKRAAKMRTLAAQNEVLTARCQLLMLENYELRGRILELRGLTSAAKKGRHVRA